METTSPSLLIAWHSRTGASEALAQAAFEGAAGQAAILSAEQVTPAIMLRHTAYLFVCPENLAGMSGVMKDMFDRLYYPLLGRIEGRPYATIIAAGSDGAGAQRQLDRIVTGWRLRRVAEPMIVNFAAETPDAILAEKSLTTDQENAATELGAALAEGLRLGVF